MKADAGTISLPLAAPAPQPRSVAPRWLALRRSRRTQLGLLVIVFVGAVTLLAPLLGRYDPTFGDYDQLLAAPSPAHLFGTDNFGRDVLARVLTGYRVSIPVGGRLGGGGGRGRVAARVACRLLRRPGRQR